MNRNFTSTVRNLSIQLRKQLLVFVIILSISLSGYTQTQTMTLAQNQHGLNLNPNYAIGGDKDFPGGHESMIFRANEDVTINSIQFCGFLAMDLLAGPDAGAPIINAKIMEAEFIGAAYQPKPGGTVYADLGDLANNSDINHLYSFSDLNATIPSGTVFVLALFIEPTDQQTFFTVIFDEADWFCTTGSGNQTMCGYDSDDPIQLGVTPFNNQPGSIRVSQVWNFPDGQVSAVAQHFGCFEMDYTTDGGVNPPPVNTNCESGVVKYRVQNSTPINEGTSYTGIFSPEIEDTGSGMSITYNGQNRTYKNLNENNFSSAKSGNDYLEHTFNTGNSNKENLELKQLGINNAVIYAPGFKFAIEIYKDDTNGTPVYSNIDIVHTNNTPVRTDINLLLDNNTTYISRVYLYDVTGASTQTITNGMRYYFEWCEQVIPDCAGTKVLNSTFYDISKNGNKAGGSMMGDNIVQVFVDGGEMTYHGPKQFGYIYNASTNFMSNPSLHNGSKTYYTLFSKNKDHAEITIKFATPINDPIIHFEDIGGSVGSIPNSTAWKLVTPNAKFSKLTGSPNFLVSNTEVTMNVNHATVNCPQDGGNGSVIINGEWTELNLVVDYDRGYLPSNAIDGVLFAIEGCDNTILKKQEIEPINARINPSPVETVANNAESVFSFDIKENLGLCDIPTFSLNQYWNVELRMDLGYSKLKDEDVHNISGSLMNYFDAIYDYGANQNRVTFRQKMVIPANAFLTVNVPVTILQDSNLDRIGFMTNISAFGSKTYAINYTSAFTSTISEREVIANDDIVYVKPGETVEYDITANDVGVNTTIDRDGFTLPMFFPSIFGHLLGQGKGVVRYTAKNDFTGEESFEYTIRSKDDNSITDVATVRFVMLDEDLYCSSADQSKINWASYHNGDFGDFSPIANAIDENGVLFLLGKSTNLTASNNAYQNTKPGGTDLAILRIDADGSTITNATWFGTNKDVLANTNSTLLIGYDNKPIIVTAIGANDAFPVSNNALKSTNDEGEILIAKLSNDLTTLDWATYYGGSGQELLRNATLNTSGDVVVALNTWSTDFPTTQGVIFPNPSNGNNIETALGQIASNGQNIIRSTYLGGEVKVNDLVLNNDVIGLVGQYTKQPEAVDLSANAYDKNVTANQKEGFIGLISSNMEDQIVYSAFGNSQGEIEVFSADLDDQNNIVFVGVVKGDAQINTSNTAYSTTKGSGFVAKLSADGQNLLAATYLNGTENYEYPTAVKINKEGDIDIIGTSKTAFTGTFDTGSTGQIYQATLSDDLSVEQFSIYLDIEEADNTQSGIALNNGFTYNRIDGTYNFLAIKGNTFSANTTLGTFGDANPALDYRVYQICSSKTDIEFTTAATDKTIECNAASNDTQLNAWLDDNGGAEVIGGCGNFTWSNNYNALTAACGNTGEVEVTFTATDNCGTTVSTSAIFKIEDTQAPTMSTEAQNLVLECDGNGNANEINNWLTNNGNAIVTDLCGAVSWTNNFDENNYTDNGGNTKSQTVTFIANDACGKSVSTIATITVQDTQAPVLDVEPSDITISCGESKENDIQQWIDNNAGAVANDVCSNVTWTNTYDPVSLDGCGVKSTQQVFFTATDDNGNEFTTSANITIEDTDAPIITTNASDKTIVCGAEDPDTAFNNWLTANGGAIATDYCGEVTWSNNYTSKTTTCGSTFTAEVTFTATDNCGNAVSNTAKFEVIDNTNPTLSKNADDITLNCSSANTETEINNWLRSNGGANATDDCGNIKWTNDYVGLSDGCGNSGSAVVVFTATDDCGNLVTTSAMVTVVDESDPEFTVQPTDLVIECESTVQASIQTWLNNHAGAKATDACGGAITWSHDYQNLTTSCGNAGSQTVTFTIEDACGNTATSTAKIEIKDTTVPTISTLATNKTVECGDENKDTAFNAWLDSNGGAIATDNCGNITWSNNYTSFSDECGETGSVEVTFTATDDCNNKSTTKAIFTFQDTTAPTISTDAINETIECNGSQNLATLNDWVDNHGGAIAIDACGTITWTNDFSGLVDGCGNAGHVTVTFTATDDCGNASTTSATYTIEDKTNPVITKQPKDLVVNCSEDNSTEINDWITAHGGMEATDACGNVTWSNNYEGLSDNGCNGTGSAMVVFSVQDECGNISTSSAMVSIIDEVKPEIIVNPSDLTLECGETVQSSIESWLGANGGAKATDGCGEVTWTNDYVELDNSCGGAGQKTVIFTASDACGNKETVSAKIEISDTKAPSITVEAISKTVECGEENGQLQAWLNSNGGANATDACGNITWSNNFTSLSDGCGNTGSTEVTFTATDACGNSVETIATFSVVDTKKPTFSVEAQDLVSDCENGESDLVDWLADNGGAVVINDCSDVTWTNNYTQFNYSCGKSGEVSVTFTATDACGNTGSTSAIFKIIDQSAPQIVAPAEDVTLICDGEGNTKELSKWLNNNGGAKATDNCSEITWSNDFGGFQESCGAQGKVLVVFVATDACGNMETTEAVFEIIDDIKPTFNDSPSDITVDCNNIPAAQNFVATDNCDDKLDISMDEQVISGSCENSYEIIRTWTATDDCGNIATMEQSVFVIDEEAPTLVNIPGDITLQPGQENMIPPVSTDVFAMDNCDNDVTIAFHEDKTKGCSYQITRIWTATDNCGNEGIGKQIIKVLKVGDFEVIPEAELICEGGSIKIETKGVAEYYKWSGPNNFIATSKDILIQNVTSDNAGLYNVEIFKDGCKHVFSTLIEVEGIPDYNIAGSIQYCEEEQIVLEASGGNSFHWEGPMGFSSTEKKIAIGNISTILHEGTYSLTITNASGCAQELSQFVTVYRKPNAVINNVESVCAGSEVNLTGFGGAQYLWNGPNVHSTDKKVVVNTTLMEPGIKTYELIVSSEFGCKDTTSVDVNIIGSDTEITIYGDREVCEGQAIELTVTDGMEQYIWQGPNGFFSISKTIEIPNTTQEDAGKYNLTVMDGDCQFVYVADISIVDCNCEKPVLTDIDVTPTSCGLANGEIELSPSTYKFIWENGYVGAQRSDLDAGIYTIKVEKYGNSSCFITKEIEVESIVDFNISSNVVSKPSCNMNNGQVQIKVSGGIEPYQILWSDGYVGANRNQLEGGSYNLIIKDANNCSKDYSFELSNEGTGEITVNIENKYFLTCAGANTGSINYSLDLGADFVKPAKEYLVNSNGQNVENGQLTKGNYCLKIHDGNDCLVSENCFEVVEPDLISADLNISPTSCSQGGSIYLTVSGGNGNYSFDWNDLEGDNNIKDRKNLDAGQYDLIISDKNGCLFSLENILIEENCDPNCDAPVLSYEVTKEDCGQKNGAITFVQNQNVVYNWPSQISTNNTAANLESGTYSVSISWADDTGCFNVIDVTVGKKIGLSDIETTIINVDCGNKGSITLLPYDYEYKWENGFVGNSKENLVEDTYYVTATNQNGCQEVLEIEVENDCDSNLQCNDFNIFEVKYKNIKLDDCEGVTAFCFPIKSQDIDNYQVVVDQEIITSFSGCNYKNTTSYSYSTVPSFGAVGPYELVDWEVGSFNFSCEFDDIEDLLSQMNQWDPNGNWIIKSDILLIAGGDGNTAYGPLEIKQLKTNKVRILPASVVYDPTEVGFNVGKGIHKVSISDLETGCVDEIVLHVGCSTLDTIKLEVVQNENELLCCDTEDSTTIRNICPEDIGEFAMLEINQIMGCINIEGIKVGSEMACIEKCNSLGCDTTILIIDVIKEKIKTVEFVVPLGSSKFYSFDTPNNSSKTSISLIQGFNSNKAAHLVNLKNLNVEIKGLKLGQDVIKFRYKKGQKTEVVILNVNVTPRLNGGGWINLMDDELIVYFGEKGTVNVLANDYVEKSNVQVNITQNPIHGKVMVNPDNTVTFIPEENYCNNEDVDFFEYEVKSDFGTEKAKVILEIMCDEIMVYSGISPNGDGINDFLLIKGIEMFPENEISIFNLYGKEVFNKINYQNSRPWDGKLNGKDLPQGTYFYILKVQGKEQKYSGNIYIGF